MEHRTVVLRWLPRSRTGWQTFTAARQEAARLWNDMVERHARIRRWRLPWPTQRRWERWAKRKYPGLSAQSVQQTIAEFCEAVNSARQLRKGGHAEARYPWRRCRYRDVTYTNQDARMRDGRLILPNGQSGTLCIRIPDGVTLPGRMMEVHLGYGRVLIVCEVPEPDRSAKMTIGVDLGVNSLVAAHVPIQITYLRPRCRSSSGGHPASSSRQRGAARL